MFRRHNARLFLPFISSLFVGAAFWIDKLWFFSFFALVPFYAAVDRLPRRRGFAAAVIFIAASAVGLGYPLLTFRSVQSAAIGGGPFIFLVAVAAGYILLLAAAALLALWMPLAYIQRWHVRIFAAPAAWLLFEFIQGKISFSLRWFSAAEPFAVFPYIAVWSRFGGEYTLAVITVICNIALFESWRRFSRRRPFSSAVPSLAVLAGIGVMIAGGWIYIKLAVTAPAVPARRQLRIAVVQRGPLPPSAERGQFFSDTIRLTREAIGRDGITGADLVIFPGNYFGSLSRAEFEMLDVFDAVLGFKPADAPSALIGFSLIDNDGRRQVLALVLPDGNREYSAKSRLMPFADFTPAVAAYAYPSFPDLSGRYVPGPASPLKLPSGIRIAAVSCSEVFAADHVRRFAKQGVDVIVISGNLEDFKSGFAHRKAVRIARLRAIETGLPTVLAMKNGVSAVIDPRGRVIQSLGKDRKGVLRAEIPL